MKAYKGFNEDMTCRGFQYEEGATYRLPEGQEPMLCERGFHATLRPLDVLRYYPEPTAVFHEVELFEVSDERESDSKVVAGGITIGRQLTLTDLVGLATPQERIEQAAHYTERAAYCTKQAAHYTKWAAYFTELAAHFTERASILGKEVQ